MAKKIYVGNLSFQATEEQVREMFSEFGDVESVTMITDRETGRFRGFCFVEMENAAADAAITALDGREVDGRALRVNEARPREERSGGQRSGGSGGYRGGGGQRSGGSGGYRGGGSQGGQRRDGGGGQRRDSGGGQRRSSDGRDW